MPPIQGSNQDEKDEKSSKASSKDDGFMSDEGFICEGKLNVDNLDANDENGNKKTSENDDKDEDKKNRETKEKEKVDLPKEDKSDKTKGDKKGILNSDRSSDIDKQTRESGELQQVIVVKADETDIKERKAAPAPTDAIYPPNFPSSPVRLRPSKAPVQKLQTVSLQEATQAKGEAPSETIEIPEVDTSRILDQTRQVIPVQQLNIKQPSGSPSPSRKPIPSKPYPAQSLRPKHISLERSPSPHRTPSVSPIRENAPSPVFVKSERKPPVPPRTEVHTQKKEPKHRMSISQSPLPMSLGEELFELAQSGIAPASVIKHKTPTDYGLKLLALCRKGDWVGVDTIMKFSEKYNIEPDLNVVAEGSGWTPLMFAVKDNRVQIVEKLLDLGYNVNTQAKVRFR